MNTETQEIQADLETMRALGQAENELILNTFKAGILHLALDAEIWGSQEGIGITDAELFEKVGELMEWALKARMDIRTKYKVSLL